MALSAVLIGMIVAVSTGAQQIYDATSARVEVLQKARYVLNDVRDHLKGALVTSDLEFFTDTTGGNLARNGHWEEGEEIKDTSGPNLVGGRPQIYDEGAHIIERQYTSSRFGGESTHANFSIYFKAPTVVKGQQRVANIEYYLADPVKFAAGETGKLGSVVDDNTNLALVKVVRYIDTDPENLHSQELKVKEARYELCPNVTDFKVEYFYDNTGDKRPGRFITPAEEARGEGGLKSEQRLVQVDGGYLKEFLYGGFKQNTTRGTAKPGQRQARTGLNRPPHFEVGDDRLYFSELKFGDTLYIWTDGGAAARFPSGDYTVKRREIDRIYFQEAIDDSGWDNSDQGGLRFKAGYLPSTFRVTVRVLDDQGGEPRSISIVVQTYNKKS